MNSKKGRASTKSIKSRASTKSRTSRTADSADKYKNRAVVKVPGTSANCGAGFDALGLATTIYNYMDLTLTRRGGVSVEATGEGADSIPRGRRNLTWTAIERLLREVGREDEFKGAIIRMKNNVPISRGLGSSSTAIVAGLVATNEILGSPLNRQQLLTLATELEGHPDNVAPALFGGFTVSVMEDGKVQTFSFQPRVKLKLVVAVPDFELSTRLARKVLPRNVAMKDAVFNISRASMLVAALLEGREDLLPIALNDALHQPYRKKLVPGMSEVFEAAKAAGALGAVISGAGSCLIAFTSAKDQLEEKVAAAMVAEFRAHDVQAKTLLLDVDRRGAQVIRRR